MMKKIVLLFLIIPFLSISQEEGDWFPIPSDQVSYFKKNLDIHTMKIDSIVENDTAFVYYNLRSPEPIFGNEDYTIFDPYSSWLGKYISVDEDKVTFFTSRELYPLPIFYMRNSDEPWRYFTNEDGSYYDAFIAGKDEIEIIDGLIDSVKYIKFQGYDENGNPFSNGFQDTLILSKNYGFVKVFKFIYGLPNTMPMYGLYGLESNGSNLGFENKLSEYFNSYDVGFQLHFERNNKSLYPFKREILDKRNGEYYIDYDIEYCYENSESSEETIRFYQNVYPGQSILYDSEVRPQGIYRIFEEGEWNGNSEIIMQFYKEYWHSEYNGQHVWMKEVSGGNCLISPMYRLNEYFWAMEEICPDDDMIIQYVKAGEFEFGEPYTFDCEVGTNDLEDSSINIAPNPSNGLFYITSSEQIEEIKVYNVNGQLVWQELQVESKSIDLSNQFPGIYFVELMFSNGHIQTTKLLLNP